MCISVKIIEEINKYRLFYKKMTTIQFQLLLNNRLKCISLRETNQLLKLMQVLFNPKKVNCLNTQKASKLKKGLKE